MRIGFLLNHYEAHQVPHIAPYAFALSLIRPDWGVEILCSTAAEADFAAEIGGGHPGHSCHIARLHVPRFARMVDPLVRQVAFYRKRAVQKANMDLFARFDALVVPEMTSLALREDARTRGVKLIFTGHGAGDGYHQQVGMFDPRIDRFDLALLPGRRIADALTALGRFRTTPYAVAGYPKLELPGSPAPLFAEDRPTVLFNPTQNRKATCWHRFGTDVLDFFYNRDDYNLIFAPHVLLFRRAWTRGARLPRRYRPNGRVLIDTGSRASVDMTYLRAADIYLGDLSSQIYEFIATPRPCVFLNALGADWHDDPGFASWTFGPVVDEIASLGPALREARDGFARYRPLQEAARERQFLHREVPASRQGAQIIAEFMESGGVDSRWL